MAARCIEGSGYGFDGPAVWTGRIEQHRRCIHRSASHDWIRCG
jgi:hypothetical protein